jgi:hypothetical protein
MIEEIKKSNGYASIRFFTERIFLINRSEFYCNHTTLILYPPIPEFPFRDQSSFASTKGDKLKSKSDKKLNRKEAAFYIDRTYGTLAVWACKKRYLKPFKEGGKVYYWQSDLDRFLREEPRRVKKTERHMK